MKWLSRRRGTILGLVVVGTVLLAVTVLTALVAVLIDARAAAILAGVVVVLAVAAARLRKRIPGRTFLEIDLDRGVVEHLPTVPAGRLLAARRLPLRDVVDGLARAAADDRVRGLVARLGNSRIGLAHAQEIREAVAAFRAAGKKTIAFAEEFGESDPATADYYLATAFEEVYLQPGSALGFTGLQIRVPFVAEALEKLSMQARFDHREEFKSAMYTFTESDFTEPHRRMVDAILDSQFEQVVADVAASRRLDPEAVRRAADAGPMSDEEAVAAGLIDGAAYRDEVYDKMRADTGAEPLYLSVYLRRVGRPHRRGPRIALIYGTGAVTRGEGRFGALPFPGATMGSDTITKALREAADDKRVKGILFRVDSPGGSAVGSEAIWREVVRAESSGTPVVVSMGNVAGSGGYYVAVGAGTIVAQPATITGSIGVVYGKVVTAGSFRKAGVTVATRRRGRNAGFWSSTEEFGDAGWDRVQALLDRIYRTFRARVESGRDLTPEQVHAAAKGRVWTGSQALENGLVDELGGLARALELVKERAEIPAERSVRLAEYPRRRRRLTRLGPESSEAFDPAIALADAVAGISAAGRSPLAAPLAMTAEWW